MTTSILCNLAPADISKQIPAWSLLTSAFLFRDADHMKKTFKSDVGKEFIKMAKDQLGIQIITPVYFGSRSVNLKPDKQIKTPADMAGIKLRMPPGEFWQFLGESLGANPTPVAYAELYTALQTGTVDGQDNPVVASKLMKFDEVTTQFVLTRHVIAYDVMSIRSKIWDAMTCLVSTNCVVTSTFMSLLATTGLSWRYGLQRGLKLGIGNGRWVGAQQVAEELPELAGRHPQFLCPQCQPASSLLVGLEVDTARAQAA